MGHSSSVSLPRVVDDQRAVRLLRLRADDRLADALFPGLGSEAARVRVPSREAVELGDLVSIEVSFGPMADEVVLDGVVSAVHETEPGRPPLVEIGIAKAAEAQVRYVRAVLDGNREATARTHRRVEVDLVGRWSRGSVRNAARIRDLSPGGAFISSRSLPRLGETVDLEIATGRDREMLRLSAATTWLRQEGQPGFGVKFSLRDRSTAARVREIVRAHESDAWVLMPRPSADS